MISLQKLAELPRSQRLRKAAKLAGEAERGLIIGAPFSADETEYFGSLAGMLAADKEFSEAARDAFLNVRNCFLSAREKETSERADGEIRRSLDTVYHLLLTETGTCRADWDFIETSGVLDPSRRHSFSGMGIYLEDIRSPFNVGSMFRAAESFGAEKIWLSPLCADPRHKRAERTARGCVDVLPWERLSRDPFDGVDGEQGVPFTRDGFFALETGGVPLDDFCFPSRGVLIAGSEELGVSPRALAAADASLGRVSIPTWGAKGSLNVSVAFGIVARAWAARLAKL